MGGIIIVLGILVGTLTFAHLTVEILLALGMFLFLMLGKANRLFMEPILEVSSP